MITQELYEEVQAHALEHYTDGGWDVIVECVDGKEELNEFFDGTPSTLEEAIDQMKDVISVWADRQADARNSAF